MSRAVNIVVLAHGQQRGRAYVRRYLSRYEFADLPSKVREIEGWIKSIPGELEIEFKTKHWKPTDDERQVMSGIESLFNYRRRTAA